MTIVSFDLTQSRAARLAGFLLLFAIATGIFSESYVRGGIITRNAAETAQNILNSGLLFRLSILADIFTYTSVVILIWALYVLLKPISRKLVLLALSLRLVEVAVHFVTVFGSLIVLRLLSGQEYLNSFDASELHTLAKLALSAQGAGISLGFVLLGSGSAVFAYLLYKSGYIPKIIAGWGIFASLLLATMNAGVLAFPATIQPVYMYSMAPMGIYEITLGFWLLIKGAKLEPNSTA